MTRSFWAWASARPTNSGLPNEAELENVVDAVDYIAGLRQAKDLATLPVGRRVVVIGGGMTAIDVAVQSKQLGAENVTIVYRRGPEQDEGEPRSSANSRRRAASHPPLGAPRLAGGPAGRSERRRVRAHARARRRAGLARLGLPHRGRHAVHRDRAARTPETLGGDAGSKSRTDASSSTTSGAPARGRLGRRRLRSRRAGPDGQRGRGRQAGGALDHAALGAAVQRGTERTRVPWPICAASFLGIKSPNPFWLASAPPTDRKINVERAFRAGWGGVVWKTLGEAGPPVVNVSGRATARSTAPTGA